MASSRRDDPRAKDIIPDIIIDDKTRKKYVKGKFLGKGGFAKCFELIDQDTKQIFAGKIVPKALLVKPQQREKMTQEIEIQRSLQHKHVVKFFSFFEDQNNVYIILELCRRRSLMELHKRRKAVTEPETRYFMKQLVQACIYLHNSNIIHRDLKLGNLFLNDDMELKIGDFGLATRVEFNGERKRTLCGTPNYIAPEVLCKKGHSFEVDVWSLGCILYTLLCGKPPFETSNLKETYGRIRRNDYTFPSRIQISAPAKHLVQSLLQSDPAQRPTMHQILEHEFIVTGYLPQALPTSCLTMAPRFDAMPKLESRRPLSQLNGMDQVNAALVGETEKLRKLAVEEDKPDIGIKRNADDPDDYWVSDLHQQIIRVTAARQPDRICIDDSEDPACVPIYWVCKWVDYSDKYGLGYQLCDNSIGVLFNDSTRLLLTSNGENIQYIERDFTEHLHTLKHYPESLTKKVTLLKYFRNYMSEHLLKAGANMVPRSGDEMIRLPFLRTWFRTRSAIILHLSNGTIQINFFQDHTKIILCPLMGAVSFIDQKRDFRTFRLSLIEKYGSSRDLASRLRYAKNMIERLMTSLTKTGGATGTSSTKSSGMGSIALTSQPPQPMQHKSSC